MNNVWSSYAVYLLVDGYEGVGLTAQIGEKVVSGANTSLPTE